MGCLPFREGEFCGGIPWPRSRARFCLGYNFAGFQSSEEWGGNSPGERGADPLRLLLRSAVFSNRAPSKRRCVFDSCPVFKFCVPPGEFHQLSGSRTVATVSGSARSVREVVMAVRVRGTLPEKIRRGPAMTSMVLSRSRRSSDRRRMTRPVAGVSRVMVWPVTWAAIISLGWMASAGLASQ